jgi:hypothetical protein
MKRISKIENTFLKSHSLARLSKSGNLFGGEAIKRHGFVVLSSDVIVSSIVVEVDGIVGDCFFLCGNSAEERQSGQGQIQLHLFMLLLHQLRKRQEFDTVA